MIIINSDIYISVSFNVKFCLCVDEIVNSDYRVCFLYVN